MITSQQVELVKQYLSYDESSETIREMLTAYENSKLSRTSSRKVKEILNLVANSEHYSPAPHHDSVHSRYMCFALNYAEYSGLITKEEKDLATKAIDKYLRKFSEYNQTTYYKDTTVLMEVLEEAGLPSSFEDRKAIYQDWANRPKPWKGD